MVCAENLHFAYGKKQVLRGVSFTVRAGAITTLMGANGCGKSTLLHLMSKNLKPDVGTVLLDGSDLRQISLREFARRAAIVHQKNAAPEDLTVRKLTAYGRLPYSSLLHGQTAQDRQKVDWALSVTGMDALAEQPIGMLSGGQRQRAFIAMALAQDTKLLFLDEPTTFLDVRYQIELLRLIRSLNRDLGITIVMVLHDINQAIAYSDEVIGLKDGRIFCQGAPAAAITTESIRALYDIDLEVVHRDEKVWVMTV